MIAYVAGKLMDRGEASVVIDTGGVGYEVYLPSGSQAYLRMPGDEVAVHTVQIE
jgi:Holliday junction DNA helicase RuvA